MAKITKVFLQDTMPTGHLSITEGPEAMEVKIVRELVKKSNPTGHLPRLPEGHDGTGASVPTGHLPTDISTPTPTPKDKKGD